MSTALRDKVCWSWGGHSSLNMAVGSRSGIAVSGVIPSLSALTVANRRHPINGWFNVGKHQCWGGLLTWGLFYESGFLAQPDNMSALR